MKPRSKQDRAPKPMSVYQCYLALRRVFKNQELPPSQAVRSTLRGMIKRFIRRFGIEALRPKRVEPITPAIVRGALQRAREGAKWIGYLHWSLDVWNCFIVMAWMVINLSTAMFWE